MPEKSALGNFAESTPYIIYMLGSHSDAGASLGLPGPLWAEGAKMEFTYTRVFPRLQLMALVHNIIKHSTFSQPADASSGGLYRVTIADGVSSGSGVMASRLCDGVCGSSITNWACLTPSCCVVLGLLALYMSHASPGG